MGICHGKTCTRMFTETLLMSQKVERAQTSVNKNFVSKLASVQWTKSKATDTCYDMVAWQNTSMREAFYKNVSFVVLVIWSTRLVTKSVIEENQMVIGKGGSLWDHGEGAKLSLERVRVDWLSKGQAWQAVDKQPPPKAEWYLPRTTLLGGKMRNWESPKPLPTSSLVLDVRRGGAKGI